MSCTTTQLCPKKKKLHATVSPMLATPCLMCNPCCGAGGLAQLATCVTCFFATLQTVTTSLLNIYQNMLGLRFEEDAQLSKAAWHPDVKAYKVYNRPSGKLIGYFYMGE